MKRLNLLLLTMAITANCFSQKVSVDDKSVRISNSLMANSSGRARIATICWLMTPGVATK